MTIKQFQIAAKYPRITSNDQWIFLDSKHTYQFPKNEKLIKDILGKVFIHLNIKS